MKTISEMNIEELREELTNAQAKIEELTARAEKAEKEAETNSQAWSYLNKENDVLKKRIESIKTVVNLL